MNVTREYISCTLELREILLSFQAGFNLVSATVVCAEPRYLKLVTVSSFCPFILISVLMTLVLVCHQLGLLGNDLHAVGSVCMCLCVCVYVCVCLYVCVCVCCCS